MTNESLRNNLSSQTDRATDERHLDKSDNIDKGGNDQCLNVVDEGMKNGYEMSV